ncbi:MAG: hypothetical protein R2741_15330 [Methanolobus sp.]
MSWYVIDAIDRAMERTRTCLIEPFDLMKWLKLALIVFFVGGVGFNSGGNGGSYGDSYDSSYGGSGSDISWIPHGIQNLLSDLDNLMSEHIVMFIAGIVAFILLFSIIMGLIGSVMEFVFVESLVQNDVRIMEYFSRYLGSGIALFILRIVIVLVLMIPVAIFGLLFFVLIAGAGESDAGTRLGIFMVFVLFAFVILFIFAASAIESFTNMAIPVSIYANTGIFAALFNVLGQFKKDWKQIIIYWIGRAVLTIAASIIVAIIGLIGIVILGLILLIIDAVIYFVFMAILSETIVWIMFVPILIVEFIIFLFVMAFIGMPVSVFLKYHMLSFLEQWYPVNIPFFDGGRSYSEAAIEE